MGSWPSLALLVVFATSAIAIWVAGIQLSEKTDVLSERLHIGSALGGLILLALATNLPEVAITVSAALSDQLDIAVGNILGGIAVQTVVLAVLDGAGVRPRSPLTYLAASLALVIEGALVVTLLALVIMGTQMPDDFDIAGVDVMAIVIAVTWIGGLLIVHRAQKGLPWMDDGHAPDSQAKSVGHSKTTKEQHATGAGHSTVRVASVFGVAAVVTMVAGVLLERSGEEFFGRQGLSGVLFGATVLAAATALPEISTGITSARMGDYKLAISDIFGGNAFLPVLFVVASVIAGHSVLPSAHGSDIYLTALGVVLTVVYMTGLLLRPQRQFFRLGPDSLAVVVLYAAGIGGLTLLTG